MATLQELLKNYCFEEGRGISPIPSFIEKNLHPSKPLRPYQKKALQYALTYFDAGDFEGKEPQPDLLFQMATGSGKTLMMAAMILYLYKMGYRNFLFFVDTNNIIGKTKDNFFNPGSGKYLFADKIVIDNQRVELNMVENFQHVNPNAINICLSTIQKLHTDLNNPKEGCLTFDDFSSFQTVLISDEAHHLNTETKKGKTKTGPSLPGFDASWENTAVRIFKSNDKNIMLEFTATSGMDQDPNLRAKYEPKLIFDYALKQYRQDGYSKEVETVQTSADDFYRALAAVVLSQFKLKLFESIGLRIKPVVMFKSKKIVESKAFFEAFKFRIEHLSVADLKQILSFANDDLKRAFDYFEQNNITLDNLLLELREDFSAEKLLIVNQQSIEEKDQITLNTLEDPQNKIRCVFAVDMLNEGWDVLNLFDIVRMYETRDAKNGKPGKTTIQEAQLIGRGARYMPFNAKDSSLQADKRKFDNDLDNPLRIIEKLHYHTATDSKYVNELRKALIESGIAEEEYHKEIIRLKPKFKDTDLYKHGYVFANRRIDYIAPSSNDSFSEDVLSHNFSVILPKRSMKSDTIFLGVSEGSGGAKYKTSTLLSLGKHVVRCALNSNPDFNYRNLKRAFPPLTSIEAFITSPKFLAGVKVDVHGDFTCIVDLTQRQKLFVAQNVLSQISPLIFKKIGSFVGSRDFTPIDFKSIFKDQPLKFSIAPNNSDKEFGISIRNPKSTLLKFDPDSADWYAYDDCFGTSEEKSLIKYIESIIDKLSFKYSDIYLVRNEKALKIFAFEDGAAFEPDFVLFMRNKNNNKDKFDNIQIFIEPKGNQLVAKDKWKEDFLLQIGKNAILSFETQNDKFRIWGVPFFNTRKKQKFAHDFEDSIEI